jgi:hypothetical protein
MFAGLAAGAFVIDAWRQRRDHATQGNDMSNVHMIVGLLTLVLYITNAVMYGMNMFRGQPVGAHRLVSISAATLLLLQYALGFMLLGAGESVPWTHWVLALVTIVPVGIEHMFAATETNMRRRGTLGLFATVVTVILVLVVYAIGEMAT